jgi:hypothetical protein
MSYHPSNKGYIGIGKQAAKGTAVAPQKYISYTSDETAPTFEAETLREGGDGQYDVTSVKTKHMHTVNFGCYARTETAANLYAALLGSDTPSHLTTSPFYHTIVPQATQCTTPVQDWLTVNKVLTCSTNSKVERIRDVKLSSITLEAEAGQPVAMSVEGSGITAHLTTSTNTATYETGNPFSFYHGVYHVNAPTTSNFDIKSFSIAIRAVNDEEIQTVGLTRQDIINHRFEVEVTLGINYTDYQLYQKANYGNTTTPTEDFSDGSATVILKTNAGTTSEERLSIGIPKVRLQPISVPLNPEVATLEQSMAGIGFKQATTALVTVTCYNQIATTLPL